jgi:hypothetical protein
MAQSTSGKRRVSKSRGEAMRQLRIICGTSRRA